MGEGITFNCFGIGGIKGETTLAFDEPGLHMILGENGIGKSSLCRAIRACSQADPNPLRLPATRRQAYVNSELGEDWQPMATLESLKWARKWWVKQGNITETGKPPTHYGAELAEPQVLGETGKVSVERWERILRLAPSEEELAAALAGAVGEGSQTAGDILGLIRTEKGSTEMALALIGDRIRESKRRWEEAVAATGERKTYGGKAAEAWRPRSWSRLAEASPLKELEEQFDAVVQELADSRRNLRGLFCPKCWAPLALEGGELVVGKAGEPAEQRDYISMQQAFDDHRTALEARRAYGEAERERALVLQWEAARAALAQAGKANKEEAMKGLQEELAAVFPADAKNRSSAWKNLAIAVDIMQGGISIDGRYPGICSRSEQWITGAALALITAAQQGCPVVAIDEGEVVSGSRFFYQICDLHDYAKDRGIILLVFTALGKQAGAELPPVLWNLWRLERGEDDSRSISYAGPLTAAG